jgi:hypothetical protein
MSAIPPFTMPQFTMPTPNYGSFGAGTLGASVGQGGIGGLDTFGSGYLKSPLSENPEGFGTFGSNSVGGPPAKGFDTLGMFGAGAQGLSALGSLLQAYNGSKQVQLGRDSFNFQKSAYNQDSANQAKMVNSELEDRQKSRISSTGNNNANNVYEGLDSYLNKNRVTVAAA